MPRNAKVGNLQDDERASPHYVTLTLEGFTSTHLGGFGGEQRQSMRNRDIRWWRDWLSYDPACAASGRGRPFWCFGASLRQVLPLSLSQEFSEFFNGEQGSADNGQQHRARGDEQRKNHGCLLSIPLKRGRSCD